MKVKLEFDLPEICKEDACKFFDDEYTHCNLFGEDLDPSSTTPCDKCLEAQKNAVH